MEPPHHSVDTAHLVLDVLDRLESVETPPEELSSCLSLLASERRRHVITIVSGVGEPITLADVADEVAIRESGRPLTELSPERVARVYTSLYHDHLPRLQDAGIVTYDQERDLVGPGWD